MDTTRLYILMCELAREVRENHKIGWGDFFIHIDYRERSHRVRVSSYTTVSVHDNYIWLPRQDQLQGMLGLENYSKVGLLDKLRAFMFTMRIDKNTSFEQIWLAFVMKEKYKKVWNGNDWIKGE